jgi:predicted RNA binding protein YcfA (HicA-like mRNA interferase family)
LRQYEPKPKVSDQNLRTTWLYFKRSKGSHQLYHNPATNKTIIVPVHGGKDMQKGTFLAILKQAGIDKNNLD